jgi:hypothetical protein
MGRLGDDASSPLAIVRHPDSTSRKRRTTDTAGPHPLWRPEIEVCAAPVCSARRAIVTPAGGATREVDTVRRAGVGALP